MLVDARTLSPGTTIEADLCILGAGPAGITIARAFLGTDVRVVLLEGGGTQFTRSLRSLPTILREHLFEEQSLARGENVGHPYYPLRMTRVRSFGGTSNALLAHGLRACPLDAIDFEAREGRAHGGSPFGRAHLDPFYARAQIACGLGPYRYNVGDWEEPGATPRLAVDGRRLATVMFQYGPVDHFRSYVHELAAAPNTRLLLHAVAVNVATDARPAAVSSVEAATLAGNRFMVRAGAYVLALGGIDNARLLLASSRSHAAGVGNDHDLVGRYFMEHPHLHAGFFRPSDRALPGRLSLYDRREVDGVAVQAMIQLNDDVMRRERLLNAVVELRPMDRLRTTPAVQSSRDLWRSLQRGPWTWSLAGHALTALRGLPDVARLASRRLGGRHPQPDMMKLDVMAEQAPDPDSRVTLSTKRDRLGMPLARLDWRISEADRHSIRRTLELVDEELRRAGLGRVESMFGDERPPTNIYGGWHHMGTTRMHVDPALGVVDENCRVHGIDNLFIAGSSVFPTGSAANPTLTIVALALRLADHLKGLQGAEVGS